MIDGWSGIEHLTNIIHLSYLVSPTCSPRCRCSPNWDKSYLYLHNLSLQFNLSEVIWCGILVSKEIVNKSLDKKSLDKIPFTQIEESRWYTGICYHLLCWICLGSPICRNSFSYLEIIQVKYFWPLGSWSALLPQNTWTMVIDFNGFQILEDKGQ